MSRSALLQASDRVDMQSIKKRKRLRGTGAHLSGMPWQIRQDPLRLPSYASDKFSGLQSLGHAGKQFVIPHYNSKGELVMQDELLLPHPKGVTAIGIQCPQSDLRTCNHYGPAEVMGTQDASLSCHHCPTLGHQTTVASRTKYSQNSLMFPDHISDLPIDINFTLHQIAPFPTLNPGHLSVSHTPDRSDNLGNDNAQSSQMRTMKSVLRVPEASRNNTSRPRTPSLEQNINRICSTPGCTEVIRSATQARRCLSCISQAWKSRPPGIGRLLIGHQRKKTVKWAYDVVDEGNSPEPAARHSPPKSVHSFKLIIPPLRRPSGDNDVSVKSLVANRNSGCLEANPPSRHSSSQHSSDINDEWASTEASIAFDDSDLTELSSASEDKSSTSESESESESQEDLPPKQLSGLKIRLAPGAIHAALSTRKCAICKDLLSGDYHFKCCIACRAQKRQYQRKRLQLKGRHVRLAEEDDMTRVAETEYESDFLHNSPIDIDLALEPGSRLCSTRPCTQVIPPKSKYTWKRCVRCRSHGPPALSPSASSAAEECLLDQDGGTRRLRQCRNVDCGIPLGNHASNSPCPRCGTVWIGADCHVKHDCPQQSSPFEQGKQMQVKPLSDIAKSQTSIAAVYYPEYQSLSKLLSHFQTRLHNFLRMRLVYFQLKGSSSDVTYVFDFTGEFSLVALDFDLMARREAIIQYIIRVKKEFERVSNLRFKTKSVVTLSKDRVSIRFQLPPHPEVGSDAATASTTQSPPAAEEGGKDSSTAVPRGELDIAVLVDHSHKCLPGERIITRFRLIG